MMKWKKPTANKPWNTTPTK